MVFPRNEDGVMEDDPKRHLGKKGAKQHGGCV